MNTVKLRIFKDRLFYFIVSGLSAITIIPLLLILYHIFYEGISAVNWKFISEIPCPGDFGEPGGGILNSIVGTVLLVIVSSILSVPFGILVGIYLAENKKSKIAYLAKLSIEILQSVPSIIIGIIAYMWIVRTTGGFSALSGSIALSVMMLPMIIISTEETLSRIPDSLKEASIALGASYYTTVIRILIPTGFSGIITGILLGVSRIAGETAPLLFTAFGNPFMNLNLMKPVDSLPLIIFNYATGPYEEGHQLAWGASLILVIFILILNISAKLGAKKWEVKF